MVLPQQTHRLQAQLCGEGGSDPHRAVSLSSNPRTLQCHLLWVCATDGLEEMDCTADPVSAKPFGSPALAPFVLV